MADEPVLTQADQLEAGMLGSNPLALEERERVADDDATLDQLRTFFSWIGRLLSTDGGAPTRLAWVWYAIYAWFCVWVICFSTAYGGDGLFATETTMMTDDKVGSATNALNRIYAAQDALGWLIAIPVFTSLRAVTRRGGQLEMLLNGARSTPKAAALRRHVMHASVVMLIFVPLGVWTVSPVLAGPTSAGPLLYAKAVYLAAVFNAWILLLGAWILSFFLGAQLCLDEASTILARVKTDTTSELWHEEVEVLCVQLVRDAAPLLGSGWGTNVVLQTCSYLLMGIFGLMQLGTTWNTTFHTWYLGCIAIACSLVYFATRVTSACTRLTDSLNHARLTDLKRHETLFPLEYALLRSNKGKGPGMTATSP